MEIPIDFYAEAIAAILLGVVWILILANYFKDPDRDKRTLGLSLAYAFFDFAVVAGFVGILFVLMGGSPTGDALFVERFVYIFSAIATIPLAYFLLRLFFIRFQWVTYLIAVYAMALTAVYLLVPSTVVSLAPLAPTVWNTDLLAGIALLSITWAVFILLSVKSFQTARKAKEALLKRRFNLIGLAGVLGILIFFVNAITIMVDLPMVPYVSATSWSLAAAAGVVSYLGWIRFKGPRSS